MVLATVAGALGKHLRRRGQNTNGLELKAMVPVSVRADVERGALGNRVAAMMAPLPVWCEDPVARLDIVREELKGLKSGGQAVGAQVLTQMSGFAPMTIMEQASRLSARQRFFNLVVTNVPGPQIELYLHGKRLIDTFPMVPLAKNQALGVALLSYAGNDQLRARGRLRPDVGPRRLRRRRAASRSRSSRTPRAWSSPPRRRHPARRCVREGQARGVRPRSWHPDAGGAAQASTRTVADAATAVGCERG